MENVRGYIGITEAGDAGNNLAWFDKVMNNDRYLGAVLVTKSGERQSFQDKAMELFQHKKCIVHFTCTGWGGTTMEPGCVTSEELIKSVRAFIDRGFPADCIVMRCDPIIPTEEGLRRAKETLMLMNEILPDVKRRRVSIYDDYLASRKEMERRGYEPIDNITKQKNQTERRPTAEQIKAVADMVLSIGDDLIYELCAEPELGEYMPEKFHWCGCISEIDCVLMGIEAPDDMPRNGQHRFGCQCLQYKRELLSKKCRCCNNCAYCYWGRN